VRSFTELNGLDWSVPATRRAAQRALLEAKAEVDRTECDLRQATVRSDLLLEHYVAAASWYPD